MNINYKLTNKTILQDKLPLFYLKQVLIHLNYIFILFFILGFVPRPTRLDFDQSSEGQSSGEEVLVPPPSSEKRYAPSHGQEKRPAPPPPHTNKTIDINQINKNKVKVSWVGWVDGHWNLEDRKLKFNLWIHAFKEKSA